MKRILTAIDGSKASYRALELAAKLAKGLGVELKILLVRQFVVGRHDVLEVWSDEEVREIRNLTLKVSLQGTVQRPKLLRKVTGRGLHDRGSSPQIRGRADRHGSVRYGKYQGLCPRLGVE